MNTAAKTCVHGTPMKKRCAKCAVHFKPVPAGATQRNCGCQLTTTTTEDD